MKFPSVPLSSLKYESRDSYIQANKRLFRIEKQQDNDDDYATSTPLKALPSTTLTSDTVLPELEREIAQANSFMIEIDEIITEWNQGIQHQYRTKPVPFRALTPYNAREVFVPDETPYTNVSIPNAPSRERVSDGTWGRGPHKEKIHYTESDADYKAFVKAERREYIDAQAVLRGQYTDDLRERNDDSRDQFDFKHAGLK